MIVKKPRNINFLAVKISLEKQIKALQNLQQNMYKEKETLQSLKKRDISQDNQLNYIALDIEAINSEIKIKPEVYQEYLERVVMQAQIDQMNVEDYKKNNKEVLKIAHKLKSDMFISKELKDHLKEVLSVDTSNFTGEQKVQFYLALKKEVEVCRTYRKNSRK